MNEFLIVGGGVIGLSLAYELAGRGRTVTLAERAKCGREASWFGAGILPAYGALGSAHPAHQLALLSAALHPDWARRLRKQTLIDTGFRRCGGIHVARRAGELAALKAAAAEWKADGLTVEWLDRRQLRELEPVLADGLDSERIVATLRLPDECQLRNPDHLTALQQACRQLGVTLREHTEVTDFRTGAAGHIEAVTEHGVLAAEQCVITSGPWSARLLHAQGVDTGLRPIRGQMVLFKTNAPLANHVINEGPRYLVPRDDGHLLAGSTEEEVGFDKSTTQDHATELTRFAQELLPQLADTEPIRCWAGLRPGTVDGFPYLGRVPGHERLHVAAGHFRQGLFLSPGTAVVMAQLLTGEPTAIDLTPFRVLRG